MCEQPNCQFSACDITPTQEDIIKRLRKLVKRWRGKSSEMKGWIMPGTKGTLEVIDMLADQLEVELNAIEKGE